MITTADPNEHLKHIETALAPYHSPWAKPSQIRGEGLRLLKPSDLRKRASKQDLKLAAAIALIVTALQCLIKHYTGKSENQKAKAVRLLKVCDRLLPKVARKLPEIDIMMVGRRIDAINTRLGFDDQPSWMVFISLSIAILGDSFPDLKQTRLADYRDELGIIMDSLQELHNYLTKKEKAQADQYNAKATELYSLWADLF